MNDRYLIKWALALLVLAGIACLVLPARVLFRESPLAPQVLTHWFWFLLAGSLAILAAVAVFSGRKKPPSP